MITWILFLNFDFLVFSSGSTGVEYAVDVTEKSQDITNAVSILIIHKLLNYQKL